MRGVVHVKTELVVVLLQRKGNDGAVTTSGESGDAGKSVLLPVERCKALLQYASSLVLPYSFKRRPTSSPLLLFASSLCLYQLQRSRLRVVVMPVDAFGGGGKEKGFFDSNNAVALSRSFGELWQLRSGDWAKIALESADVEAKDENGEKCRCAQVYVGDEFDALGNESCCVSPQLWFSLNDHPSTLIQPDARLNLMKLGKSSTTEETNSPLRPEYADEVVIAIVQAPGYDTTECFDSLCTKYFSVTRYAQVGDIICVGSSDDIDFFPTSNEPLRLCPSTIYFKITQLSGSKSELPGYLVDNKHTNLYQAGTVFSYVPVTMDVYIGSCGLHLVWNNPQPCGLAKYVTSLERLLIPYMKSHVRKQVNPSFLLTGLSGIGKQTILKAVCRRLNLHHHQVDCYDVIGDTSSATESRLKQILNTGSMLAPCILVLRNIHVLGKMKDSAREDSRVLSTLSSSVNSVVRQNESYPLVICGTAPKQSVVSSDLTSIFVHHLHIEQPTEEERAEILTGLLASFRLSPSFTVRSIAENAAGFLLGDLCALVSSAVRIMYNHVAESCSYVDVSFNIEDDANIAGVCLQASDFARALDEMRAAHSDAIGAPKIPTVKWEDIGGLQSVKDAILDTVQLPLQHPELVASGLKRSGILLFGPPGTGKTLLAKAVATECTLHFLSVKGPELLNMYVGQSEENVREVFHRARSVAPCIIFFDELDSLAPNRGRSGDSGGVMDRVVSQLLAELDGLDKTANVFVIGATNRPDLIDPALLRPGRFDKSVYVGIGEDPSSQLHILKALTRKFNLSPDVSLEKLVELCPPNLTGADFYALCSDTLIHSMNRCIQAMKMGVEWLVSSG